MLKSLHVDLRFIVGPVQSDESGFSKRAFECRRRADPRKHRLEVIQGDVLKTPLSFFSVHT